MVHYFLTRFITSLLIMIGVFCNSTKKLKKGQFKIFFINFDELVKVVTPAKAGVQVSYKFLKTLDSGLAVIPDHDPGRNDGK